jgi:anti-anti-sigma factor
VPDLLVKAAPILEVPNSAEVLIEGGVNAANAKLLKEQLDRVLTRRTTFISIHMGSVSYVNSSGFGYFMDLASILERRGGALVLVEVQPKVKVVFNNLGMTNFFRFEHSAEAARAFLRSQHERVVHSPRLLALGGDEEGVVFPVLGASLRIGSDSKSTIAVRHAEVEARHCEVYRTGDSCFVRDLGTRAGTWIGTRKVNDEALKAGDVIRVGSLRLAFYPPGAKISP